MRVVMLLCLLSIACLAGDVDTGPVVARVRISSVGASGGLIELADGSVWLVHELDRFTSELWIGYSEILSVRTHGSAPGERVFVYRPNSSVRVRRLGVVD